MVQVTPRFPGVVRDIRKRIGDAVAKGEQLASVESNQSLTAYDLKAPIGGTVIDRQISLGEYASEQKPAFVIADLSTIWVDLSVYRQDIKRVRPNDEVLIDPFNGGAMLDPDRISAPPRMGGAEGVHLAQPVGDADVLIRLENNLKVRALQIGDRGRAREIAKRMVLIGPGKAELWLDLARLNEGAGVMREARAAYEACLEIAKPGQSLHNEAAIGLSGLKRMIN
jgi:multidrug efflux pump subunit AcrA (membrane-fusion protein)